MGQITKSGIVLITYPSGESDQIVKILTETEGVYSLIGKYSRKSKRRFAGGFEPFDWGKFEITDKGSGLSPINNFSRTKSFRRIREDFSSLALASLVCEATHHMVPERTEEEIEIYYCVVNAISTINEQLPLKDKLKDLFKALAALLHYQGIGIEKDLRSPSLNHLINLLDRIEEYSEKQLKTRNEIDGILSKIKAEHSLLVA